MRCVHCGRAISQGWQDIWQHEDTGYAVCNYGDVFVLEPEDIKQATPSTLGRDAL